MAIEQDRTTISQFFALLGDGDIDDWLKLIDKAVRVTTPLTEKGSPTLCQGIEEVNARFGDARKGLKELLFYDIDLLATEDDPASDQLDRQERAEWTRAAVMRLPETLRTAVQLVYFQGLKYREAADELAVPVGTVKSRLHSAVVKLREAWAQSCFATV